MDTGSCISHPFAFGVQLCNDRKMVRVPGQKYGGIGGYDGRTNWFITGRIPQNLFPDLAATPEVRHT